MNYNLEAKNKINSDFPYLIQNNFIDKLELNKLNQNFPTLLFNKINKEHERKNINFRNLVFQKFCKENETWKNLSSLLYSSHFTNKVLKIFENYLKKTKSKFNFDNPTFYSEKIFKDDLKKKLNINDKLNIKINKIKNFLNKKNKFNKIKIHAMCSQSISNYGKRIHLDGRSKLIVGLFYLNNMEGKSNINFYRKISNQETRNKNDNFVEEKNLEVIDSVTINENKLILFANTPFSFHGVENTIFNKKRNFIYFSLGY